MRLRLGAVEHDLTTRSLVMGVIGSAFGRGGATANFDALLADAEAMVAEGADVLDLGRVAAAGEPPTGEDEELGRLVPAIEALRARLDVALSVDTDRPRVLVAAAAAGAAIAFDRQGLGGADHLHTAHGAGIAIVIGHRRSQVPPPATRGQVGIVDEVRAFLEERVARARAAGIPDERMLVDAGLDLGKSPPQSLALLRGSAALAALGPPLLLDVSNNRFLGLLLDLDVGERRMASHAAAALGIARGGRVVRAHDVRGARRVADVLAALLAARLTHMAANPTAEVGGG